MHVEVRPFTESDIPELLEILKLNAQYEYPETEGPESMRRVARCDSAVFLVADMGGELCGFIKGVYDGSRAMVHLLSVHPNHQHSGIGTALLEAVATEFLHRGASTVSATVTEESAGFWEGLNFRRTPVFLVIKDLK